MRLAVTFFKLLLVTGIMFSSRMTILMDHFCSGFMQEGIQNSNNFFTVREQLQKPGPTVFRTTPKIPSFPHSWCV